MGVRPKIIVCDFSSALIGAIREVFGEDVIQIDLYHVMQELNRGIKADLKRYRDRSYSSEINELIALRDWVKTLQDALREKHSFQDVLKNASGLPCIKRAHKTALACLELTQAVLKILKIGCPSAFFSALQDFLARLDRSSEAVEYFCDRLEKAMPKSRFTEKGMNRVKHEVLKKLKSFYLHHRKPLAQEGKRFYRHHHVLFFQPENLTPERTALLEEFLEAHPALRVYRAMTLSLGELSRRDPKELDGHRIDALSPSPEYSSKLNAAIKTIKKHKAKILRFVSVFNSNPDLSRAQRANMEYFNRNFKAIFASGNNLLKQERLLGRFKAQFSGRVDFHLKGEVKA